MGHYLKQVRFLSGKTYSGICTATAATMRTEQVIQISSPKLNGDLMVMNPMVQKVNKHITLNKVFNLFTP